jgi:hypothetical protein
VRISGRGGDDSHRIGAFGSDGCLWLGQGIDMGDVINLRMARKRARRRDSETEASASRYSHGVSQGQRVLLQAQRDKSLRDHEQHQIETGEIE